MVYRKPIMIVIVALLTLTVVPVAGAQQQQVTLFLPFIPNIQFAPVYVALEKGYFADAGFDVQLEYGSEPDGVALVAAGQREYGVFSGEQLVIARSNGLPVLSVYEWYQQYPIAVVTAADAGINTPADLAGRQVGLPGRFGATYIGLVALLEANGLTEADLTIEEIGFNAPEVVCVGGVEASTVYVNNEPIQIGTRAANNDCGDITGVTVFPVSDYADLVSNGLVVSEASATQRPDEVAAMVAAFDAAVRDTINNPPEAYLLSVPHIEGLPLSAEAETVFSDLSAAQAEFLADEPSAADIADRRDFLLAQVRPLLTPDEFLQVRVLLETIALWQAEQLGFSDPAGWQTTQDTLLSMGFIGGEIDIDAAYSNAFLPE